MGNPVRIIVIANDFPERVDSVRPGFLWSQGINDSGESARGVQKAEYIPTFDEKANDLTGVVYGVGSGRVRDVGEVDVPKRAGGIEKASARSRTRFRQFDRCR